MNTQQSRWGYLKNSTRPALTVSIPGGALITALTAGGIAFSGLINGPFWLIFTVFFAFQFPIWVAIVWELAVDCNTITGAVRDPNNSIENAWFTRAGNNTLFATFPVVGIGSAVFQFLDYDAVAITLTGIFIFITLTFVACYAFEKYRG